MKLAQIDFDALYSDLGFSGDVNISGSLTLAEIITALLPYIYTIAGLILFLYLIIGGFQFLVSGGDQNKIQAGKSKITNALVGFFILFLAYWIVQLVAIVLNVNKLETLFT